MSTDLEQIRSAKESLSKRAAEVSEMLRSHESQTKFLELARADLLTQFRSLSGKMLDGSREALLKSTKETVSEPFAKEMEQLRQQMQLLQKESVEKLGVLAQTTMDLRQRSEDVQGAAQQLTSALRSPNVKGRWGSGQAGQRRPTAGLSCAHVAPCTAERTSAITAEDTVECIPRDPRRGSTKLPQLNTPRD